MKKALLILLGVAGLSYANVATAQTFTLAKDTAKVIVYNNGAVEVKDKITNTSPTNLTISWKVTGITLPNTWTVNGFGICDNGTCVAYAKNDASLYITNTALTMAPNDTMDLKLQIDVSALPTGGPYYIMTNVTDGITSKNPVFEITNRFNTGVVTMNVVKDDVVMYPNPARGDLNVIYNGNNTIKTISVYNLIGKAVGIYKVSSNNNANLDISAIPSGIYFVRLADAQGRVVATRKFTHQ